MPTPITTPVMSTPTTPAPPEDLSEGGMVATSAPKKKKAAPKKEVNATEVTLSEITFTESAEREKEVRLQVAYMEGGKKAGKVFGERLAVGYEYNGINDTVGIYKNKVNTDSEVLYIKKNMLFIVQDKELKALFSSIFEKSEAESLLVIREKGSFMGARDVFYVKNPNDLDVELSYQYLNRSLDRTPPQPEKDTPSVKEVGGVYSSTEKLAYMGILAKAIMDSDNTDAPSSVSDENAIPKLFSMIGLVMNDNFSEYWSRTTGATHGELDENKSGFDHFDSGVKRVEDVIGWAILSLGDEPRKDREAIYQKFIMASRSETPMKSVLELVDNGEINLPYDMEGALERAEEVRPVFLDYSATNGDEIGATLEKTLAVPYMLSSKDEKFKLKSPSDEDTIEEELFRALEIAGKRPFMSAAYETIGNSISRIVAGSNVSKIKPENHRSSGLTYFKFNSKEDIRNQLTENLVNNSMGGLPIVIDGQYYMVSKTNVTEDRTESTTLGNKNRSDEEAERIAEHILDGIGNGGFSDDMLTMVNEFSYFHPTVIDHYKALLVHMSIAATFTFTRTARKNYEPEKLQELLESEYKKEFKKTPPVKKINEALGKKTDNDIYALFYPVSPGDKVLPDLQNVGGKPVSPQQVLASPLKTILYLQFPPVAQIIRNIADTNNLSIPPVYPWVCDIVDGEKNRRPDAEKDIRVSSKGGGGILDFKFNPIYIDLASSEAKKKFVDLSVIAIKNTIGEMVDKEDDPQEKERLLESINKGVKSFKQKIEPIMGMAEMVIVKSAREQKEDKIINKEQFVLVDKEYKEIPIGELGIPVYAVYDELKKEGILKNEFFVKQPTFKEDDLSKLYDGMLDMVMEDFHKEAPFFKKIGIFLRNIEELEKKTPINEIQYGMLIKKDGLDDFMKEIINSEIKTPKELASSIIEEMMKEEGFLYKKSDDLVKATASSLLPFLNEFYKNKEFIYADTGVDKTGIKRALQSNVFEKTSSFADRSTIEMIMKKMADEGKRDAEGVKGVKSLIKTFKFIRHSEQIKKTRPEGLTNKEKGIMLEKLLMGVMGMRKAQAEEVLGGMAQYMKGEVEASHLWAEPRFGKTIAALMYIMSAAVVEVREAKLNKERVGSTGVFFLQGSNIDDILLQAVMISPLMVKHHATVLGQQKAIKFARERMPIELTEHIYPNIPNKLKYKKDLLKNPDPTSSLAPSELLGRKFQSEFQKIFDGVSELNADDREKIIRKNEKIIPNSSDYFKNMPKSNVANTLATSIFLYGAKLMKEGYLEKGTPALEALRNIATDFWKSYTAEVNKKERRGANIAFITKNYIESYGAESGEGVDRKVAHNVSLMTDLDIKETEDSKYLGTTKDEVETSHEMISALTMKPEWRQEKEEAYFPILVGTRMKYREAWSFISHIVNDTHKILSKEFSEGIKGPIQERLEEAGVSRQDIKKRANSLIGNILGEIRGTVASGSTEFNRLTSEPCKYMVFGGDDFPGCKYDVASLLKDFQIKFEGDESGVIADVFSKIVTPERIATLLSDEVYKGVVRSILIQENKDKKSRVKTRMGEYINKDKNITKETAELKLHFNRAVGGVYVPQGDKLATLLSFGAEVPKASDPSEFTNKEIFPLEASFVLSRGKGGIRVHVEKAFEAEDIDGELKIKEYRAKKTKDIPNYTSGALWKLAEENEASSVSSIVVDEIHKNTGKKQSVLIREMLKQLHYSVDENSGLSKNKKLSVFLTGTPFSTVVKFGKLVEATSPAAMNRFSSELVSRCGTHYVTSDIASFILTEKKNAAFIDEALANATKKVYVLLKDRDDFEIRSESQKEKEDKGIFSIGEAFANEIFAKPEIEASFKVYCNKRDSFSPREKVKADIVSIITENATQSRILIKESTRDILAEEVKRYKIKSKDITEYNKFNRDSAVGQAERLVSFGLDSMKLAILKAGSKLSTMGHGFCMPADAARAISLVQKGGNRNTYVSVRRAGDDVQYNVIDRKASQSLKVKDISEQALALLSFENIIRKYRTNYSVQSIANTVVSLGKIAVEGIRENSVDLSGLSTEDFNRVANATKKSTKDSFLSDFEKFIKYDVPFSEKTKELVRPVFEVIDYMMNHQEETKKVLADAVDLDKIAFTFMKKDGVSYSAMVDPAELQNISDTSFPIFSEGSKRRERYSLISPLSKEGAMSIKDDRKVLYFGEGGIQFGTFQTAKNRYEENKIKKGGDIQFVTSVCYQPDERLPEIHTNINIASISDAELFEVMAFSEQTKDIMLKDIEGGKNTRSMFLRVGNGKTVVTEQIRALLERSDKEQTHEILIPTPGKEMKEFLDQIEDIAGELLEKNNIRLTQIPTSQLTIKGEEIINGGGRVHIMGNTATFAEGVALHFIDIGRFYGKPGDPAMVLQSAARQFKANIGEYHTNFGIANEGFLFKLDGPITEKSKTNGSLSKIITQGIEVKGSEEWKSENKANPVSPAKIMDMNKSVLDGDSSVRRASKGMIEVFDAFVAFSEGRYLIESLEDTPKTEFDEKLEKFIHVGELKRKEEEAPEEEMAVVRGRKR